MRHLSSTRNRGIVGRCALNRGPLAVFRPLYGQTERLDDLADQTIAIVGPPLPYTFAALLKQSHHLADLILVSEKDEPSLKEDTSEVVPGWLLLPRSGDKLLKAVQKLNLPTAFWALVAYHAGTGDRLLGDRWLQVKGSHRTTYFLHHQRGGHSLEITCTPPSNALPTP